VQCRSCATICHSCLSESDRHTPGPQGPQYAPTATRSRSAPLVSFLQSQQHDGPRAARQKQNYRTEHIVSADELNPALATQMVMPENLGNVPERIERSCFSWRASTRQNHGNCDQNTWCRMRASLTLSSTISYASQRLGQSPDLPCGGPYSVTQPKR